MAKKKAKKAKKQSKTLLEELAPDEEPEEPEDPILNKIEELFEEIKETGIVTSVFAEQKEIIVSNLIVAYYLAKLERKIK